MKPSHLSETELGLPYHQQSLKDKFNTAGADALTDKELLEIFLFSVLSREDSKPLAKALLEKLGSFVAIMGAPDSLLKDVKGVEEEVVLAFKLHQAVLGRLLEKDIQGKSVVQSWQHIIDYCFIRMAHQDKEQLRVLYLDPQNQLLRDEVQHIGTVDHTPIYPRELLKRALEVGASAFILVHNHPSGDPTPSRSDIELTLKIQKLGEELGIKLHDHVIIGKRRCHCSLKSLGII